MGAVGAVALGAAVLTQPASAVDIATYVADSHIIIGGWGDKKNGGAWENQQKWYGVNNLNVWSNENIDLNNVRYTSYLFQSYRWSHYGQFTPNGQSSSTALVRDSVKMN